MADLDKVIKGLKVCTNPATKRGCLDGLCPYDGKGCRSAMEWDALELLKQYSGLAKALEQSNAVNEHLNAEIERLKDELAMHEADADPLG